VVYRAVGTTSLCFACVIAKRICKLTKWSIHFFDVGSAGVYADPEGYRYFPIQLNQVGVDVVSNDGLALHGRQFDSFGILLPDLWTPKDSNGQYKYALVNEDWEKMDQSKGWTSLISN
jgi:hypothetical protein